MSLEIVSRMQLGKNYRFLFQRLVIWTILRKKKQPTKLMTKKEMANELDISLVSLTEWMKQGRIPYKRMGKRIYFNKEDVMASMTNFNHNKGGK